MNKSVQRSPSKLLNQVYEPKMRKGPWTEQEDLQLVWFVRLFGEKRWDFLAKVSGLNRSGKSCRLRWVNYLRPDLKRGRMTTQEERLILQLHQKWGNRWSRIAQRLPGRTDNEIKNYWRTHMRKNAQEREQLNSSSSLSGSSLTDNSSANEKSAETVCEKPERNHSVEMNDECMKEYMLMDQIWKDIAASDPAVNHELNFEEYNKDCSSSNMVNNACINQVVASPMYIWEDCGAVPLWRIDDNDHEEFKNDIIVSSTYHHHCN